MLSRILSAPEISVYINNHLLGECAGISTEIDSPRQELHTVDILQPAELTQMATRVSGSLQVYRIRRGGGAEAQGMIATFQDLTREKYFSILVLDRMTDTVVFRADNCSVTRQVWNVELRKLVMGTINFQSITWSNEVAPSA